MRLVRNTNLGVNGLKIHQWKNWLMWWGRRRRNWSGGILIRRLYEITLISIRQNLKVFPPREVGEKHQPRRKEKLSLFPPRWGWWETPTAAYREKHKRWRKNPDWKYHLRGEVGEKHQPRRRSLMKIIHCLILLENFLFRVTQSKKIYEDLYR